MIQIFHYNSLTKTERDKLNSSSNGWDSSPRFTRYANITMSAKLPDVAIGLLNREYHLVAVVDSDDLEDGFRYTNHIEADWHKQPAAIVTALPGNHRSTSVGDVFTRNGATYVVAGMGFDLLTANVE
jgi:hypothetical protein